MLASAAPIIASFGVFSPGSLLANLAVVPLAMLVISAGFTSLLLGLAHFPAGSALFNHAAMLVIRVMEELVTRGAGLPGVSWPARFAHPGLAPFALALVVAAMLAGAALGWPRRAGAWWWPATVLGVVLIFGVKFG
jgi:competence protein ComEC